MLSKVQSSWTWIVPLIKSFYCSHEHDHPVINIVHKTRCKYIALLHREPDFVYRPKKVCSITNG